jgi:hypothetical protein
MKRTELIQKLLKEGFSEKTLVNFSDNQLKQLASRILSEEDLMVSKKDPQYQQKVADAKKQNKTIEAYEELKGNQKVLDKNDNGKIDSDDFAILNKEKKGESKEDVNEVDMGLTIKGSKSSSSSVFGGVPKKSSSPKKKTTPKKKEEGETEEGEVDESLNGLMLGVIKDKLSKDLGREPENHEIDKAHEDFVNSWKKDNEYKERMKKNPYNPGKPPSPDFNGYNKRKEKKEKKEKDVDETKSKKCPECQKDTKDCKCDHTHLDENKTIKNWVKSLVENKEFHSFTSKNEIMELIQTKLNESDTMVQHGPKVKKGHNGIPEFMSYDVIKSSGPAIAPSKPKTSPTTKPGTKPSKPGIDPYNPGPKPNPKPKALQEKK